MAQTTPQITMDGVYDINETAEYLRRKKATIYGWRHEGYGPPSFMVGRKVFYRKSDIDQWLTEQYVEQNR